MHTSRRVIHWLVTLSMALTILTTDPTHVWSHHREDQRITDQTAYTLNRNEWRIGLWKIEYGIMDALQVGTYHLPWIVSVANLHLKAQFDLDERWSISPRLGLFRLDIGRLNEDAPPAILSVVPFELAISYRVGDFTFSQDSIYTYVRLKGELEDDSLHGAVAVSNFQLALTVEWRLGEVIALVGHARYLIHQEASAVTTITLRPDDYTTVLIVGGASTDALDIANAYSVIGSVVFSWNSFNLRLGVGHGNWSIPAINFVVPERTVIPELDFFWRF